ncbi:MAG: hypothetical protein IJ153_01505 [Clostridia bacterium]|nr:hypothetical protein [Clostridia bacterium]
MIPRDQNVGSDIASQIIGVKQATITKKCRKHVFPNATQDEQGHPWHIPLGDIIDYCEQRGIDISDIEHYIN